ncbi:MAG: hypothetical protein CVV49_16780 [Spirochaetae bacterium HGW-Spirochaetae-5]|nr:MAG: hypothetical protein CVV49_16780 [Spirochaetae bacterium HGW-Spirochaetae-5]
MKKLLLILFIFSIYSHSSAGEIDGISRITRDDINVEPIEGMPRHYSVNIKFASIETVTVSTTIVSESLGREKKRFELTKNEWSYNPEKNVLITEKDIDDGNFIVRVSGKYITPLRIIPVEKPDPEKIRFVIDSRIGIYGKDYFYDNVKNEIELTACKTGQEKYIIEYAHSGGSASIGSMSMSDLNRTLLKYLDWPVSGNAVKIDREGYYFSPLDDRYRSVWLVQLIPAEDGYNGIDLRSGFKWDSAENELKFDAPVDTDKFSVLILGETE